MVYSLLLTTALTAAAAGSPPYAVREPDVHMTPAWLAAQLVPSPGVGWGHSEPHLVLAWQVSPVLYAFRLDPRLSPWRFMVVEPLVRQSGSTEIFLCPEYRSISSAWFDFRVGVRSTFPLLERGEVLSMSLGTALQHAADVRSPSFEVALHTLFGFVGLSLQYAPIDGLRQWTTLLRLRFF
jgi:hypothetical protein